VLFLTLNKKDIKMIFSFNTIVLLLAALATALIAGLFYNWTTAITTGLHKLPDREYIAAMQSINQAIQNPLFFLSFFGAAILLPVCSYIHYKSPLSVNFYLLLAATILYLAGVMAVTVAGNIPLNNMLDKFDLANASAEKITAMRQAFENKWNNLNTIRTIASFISLLLVLLSLNSNRSSG
jgi:uncharacterized membrane protein